MAILITPVRVKAEEFYNTFKSALQQTSADAITNDMICLCAQAAVDKVINEIIGDDARVAFYREVRKKIEAL